MLIILRLYDKVCVFITHTLSWVDNGRKKYFKKIQSKKSIYH
jgi:hypothetical protein